MWLPIVSEDFAAGDGRGRLPRGKADRIPCESHTSVTEDTLNAAGVARPRSGGVQRVTRAGIGGARQILTRLVHVGIATDTAENVGDRAIRNLRRHYRPHSRLSEPQHAALIGGERPLSVRSPAKVLGQEDRVAQSVTN